MADVIADVSADRLPIVKDILVTRGILAGGAHVTIIGDRLDEYPVLGGWFRRQGLTKLYGFALPALRFIFAFMLSTNNVVISADSLSLFWFSDVLAIKLISARTSFRKRLKTHFFSRI